MATEKEIRTFVEQKFKQFGDEAQSLLDQKEIPFIDVSVEIQKRLFARDVLTSVMQLLYK